MKIQTPPDPSAPLKLLRAGKADVAISYEPELLLARDQGAENLVAVGALVQAPLTSLMALPGGRREDAPRTWPASASARPGIPYQSAYLKTILEKAGVDPSSVKETNVGFNLVPGDALQEGRRHARRVLELRGRRPRARGRKPVILRMEKLGVPTYNELILVARREALDAAGASRLRRFITATAAGHRLAARRPGGRRRRAA